MLRAVIRLWYPFCLDFVPNSKINVIWPKSDLWECNLAEKRKY
eukprot:UN22932